MPRIVRGGLIQAKLCEPATAPVARIKQAMTEKHLQLIAAAADRGAQVICLQELFNGPYFCAEQQPKWYALTEPIPEGPISPHAASRNRAMLFSRVFDRRFTLREDPCATHAVPSLRA